MQLNRPSSIYEGRLYSNTRDCIQKVYRHESISGFYRGILPQVAGVALGKAIKLMVSFLALIREGNQWITLLLWMPAGE